MQNLLNIEQIEKKLSQRQIQFISNFVYQRSGIVLGENKRYLIEGRLQSVARMAGLSSLDQLCRELAKQPIQLETLVLDAMTTNETSWFRDKKTFDILGNHILPQLAQSKKNSKTLQIWSAASSSGQEPYSIAIKIKESRLFEGWNIRIIGTDISSKMLKQARQGRYSKLETSRGLPTTILIKYFQQVGNFWQIKKDMLDQVLFKEHQLQGNLAPLGIFDLIFYRNVLIYFDLPTKRRILENLPKVITKEGLLILGSSESILNLTNAFDTIWFKETVAFHVKKNSQHQWENMANERSGS